MNRDEPELLQLSTLVVWLGAAAFFSIAVAPVLFAVLPSRALACDVVGRLLPPIFYSGIVVGLVIGRAWSYGMIRCSGLGLRW